MTLVLVYILVIFLFLSKNRSIHQLAILVLSILFSTRNKDVPDTVPYMEMYQDTLAFGGIESGFRWMCDLFFGLGVPFPFFIFILSFLMLEVWYYCTNRMFGKESVGVMAIMMLSYFGFYFYGMVLRSAIAITLCYIAITVILTTTKKIYSFIIYYIIIIIAFQIHQSAILFTLAPLMLLKVNLKLQYSIAIGSVLFLFLTDILPIKHYLEILFNVYADSRFGYFLERDLDASRVGIRSVLYSATSLFSVYCASKVKTNSSNKKIIDFFVNLYIVGALINSLIWELPAATRLPMNWLFFEFAVVYSVIHHGVLFKNNKKTVYIVYTIVSFALLLHSFPLILNY